MFDNFSEHFRRWVIDLLYDLASVDTELALLAVITLFVVMVLDAVTYFIKQRKIATGIGARALNLSLDGSNQVTTREYISEKQGLAGRPDAVTIEAGYFIPVETKPLANKIRDRYVAQLLVYMRLIEEFEGKRPPYGYLILGAKRRRVRVENSPERQQWLQGHLDAMRAIIDGAPPRADPHPRKCSKCDVRSKCTFKILSRADA